MESKDFDRANVTLGAGGNPNTRPLRIALCKNAQMPDYTSGFLVSKWEMNNEEKEDLAKKIHVLLLDETKLDEYKSSVMTDKIISLIPPIFLSCMHSMSPVMILQYPEETIFNDGFLIPDQEAADRVNENRFKDN